MRNSDWSSDVCYSDLLVTVEKYPDLKSQGRFADLMTQLEGTENRINISIRDYNAAVQDYNTTIRTFPDIIGATIVHGAKPMTPYKATRPRSAECRVGKEGERTCNSRWSPYNS